MNIEEIRTLIQLLQETNLSEIEVEEAGKKIRVARVLPLSSSLPAAVPAAIPISAPDASLPQTVVEETDPLAMITSPIVGTFYKAGAPGAEPYVKIGDAVKKGQTLCIVEAMKLMNEIESDLDGIIADVCVEDKSPVEFGQPLFKIKPQS